MDKMTIPMDDLASNRRYDFLPPRDADWGIHALGVGMRIAPPRVPYQVHEEGAPFQWRHGRVLADYGLVYLTRGKGLFRTEKSRLTRVRAGDMLFLDPGLWHNYFPSPETGWQEYWVLFNGARAADLARQLARAPSMPLLRPGVAEPVRRVFRELLEVARETPPDFHAILGGLVWQLIARTLSCIHSLREGGGGRPSAVQQAKQQLEARLTEPVDMVVLARSLGLGYRHFRRVFKASTGLAPLQYLLNLRVNFAKRLLEEQSAGIDEVARRAGFADPYYFSRLFRQKTGCSPSQWRQSTGLNLNPRARPAESKSR